MNTKKCSKCKIEKNISEFHRLRKNDNTIADLGGTTFGQYSFKIEGKYLGTIGFAGSPVSKRLVRIIFENGDTNNT